MDYDIAISYSRRQSDMAASLYRNFTQKGWRVFKDEERLSGEAHAGLHEAFTRAQLIVALISPDYCKSNWCRQEASLPDKAYVLIEAAPTAPSELPDNIANHPVKSLSFDGAGRPDPTLMAILSLIEGLLAKPEQSRGTVVNHRNYSADKIQVIEKIDSLNTLNFE